MRWSFLVTPVPLTLAEQVEYTSFLIGILTASLMLTLGKTQMNMVLLSLKRIILSRTLM